MDPYSGASWIRIQIGPKSGIRIQIQCIWIHNAALKTIFIVIGAGAGEKKVPGAGAGQKQTGSATLALRSH